MVEPVPVVHFVSRVRQIESGRVSFVGFNSWYATPPQLEPLFRLARRSGRKATVTADRGCNILDAVLRNSKLSHQNRKPAISDPYLLQKSGAKGQL
jgi:hypothetical protein